MIVWNKSRIIFLKRHQNDRQQRPPNHGSPPGVFIVNFEQITHIDLMFSLLSLNKKMSVG